MGELLFPFTIVSTTSNKMAVHLNCRGQNKSMKVRPIEGRTKDQFIFSDSST
jgi:hypothetical protein